MTNFKSKIERSSFGSKAVVNARQTVTSQNANTVVSRAQTLRNGSGQKKSRESGGK